MRLVRPWIELRKEMKGFSEIFLLDCMSSKLMIFGVCDHDAGVRTERRHLCKAVCRFARFVGYWA